MSDGVERIAAWLSAVVAGMVALAVTLRGAGQAMRRFQHFLDDWFGEEGRHGTKRAPGVMERLESIERRLSSVEAKQDEARDSR
jgi:hypothetical protein